MTPEQMKTLGIPEEYHNEPIFKDAPDLPTVFKITRDLNSYKGSAIRVPGPEASEADRKEFSEKLKKHAPNLVALPEKEEEREAALMERLGTPKEAKEYAPPKDHGLPDNVIERLRAEAKEEGLTKRQFERRVEREKKAFGDATARETAAQTALKQKLGASFEETLTAAAAAAQRLGASAEVVEAVRTGKVDAAVAQTYINASKALGTEPGDLGGHRGGGPTRLTPDEISSRIAEIYKNPAFLNKSDPQHATMVQRLYDYNKMLLPEE